MLKMYESSKIYAIGYDTDKGDFNKICILYKDEVSKEVANDFLEYLKECD